MYRRPKFLEILDEIREEMSRQSDYDVELFAEMVRNGEKKKGTEKAQEIISVQNLVLKDLSKIEDQSPKTKK